MKLGQIVSRTVHAILAVVPTVIAQAQHVQQQSVAPQVWRTRFTFLDLPPDYCGMREAIWRRWKPPAHMGQACHATHEWGDRFGVSAFNLDADNRFVCLRYPLGDINPNIELKAKDSFEIVGFDDFRPRVPPELFESVRVVRRSAAFETDFDPIRLVRAVNSLHALGKDGALQILSAYSRLCDGVTDRWKYDLRPERVYLIARLLFVPAKGAPAFPSAWRPPWDTPDGIVLDEGWPLFPLAMEGDVPFFALEWNEAQGWQASARGWIEYCRDYCDLREKPLHPTDPLAAAQAALDRGIFGALVHDPEWRGYKLARAKTDLRRQVAAALSTVEPAWSAFPRWQGLPGERRPSPHEYESTWQRYEVRMRELDAAWEVRTQDYVARRTESLPPAPE